MKLDPVDQKALKGPHKNAKDKDINNDGKVNSSDEYLHNRRQAVSKAIGKLKEEAELNELSKDTLNSYRDKSKKSSKELGAKLDSSPKDVMGNTRVQDHPTLDKLQNRVRGQRLAYKKLNANEEVDLDEVKKAKPGNNAMVMAKNIGKVLSAVKKEETDDASIIAKHTKPLRMKLAQFRHEE